jgi:hypothetical protein
MSSAKQFPVVILILLIIICPIYQKKLEINRSLLLKKTGAEYFLPSKFTAPASLEFKGIISDFLYLKISTFLGGKIMNKEMLEPGYADYFYRAADITTDLDPWFWDAYLINSLFLAWDFNRIDLASKLLGKASGYRSWDFNPPFYLGFYHYYFLKDNATASKYLMEAARRGGGPSYLVPLATRLSVYQNSFLPAIMLLGEQLKTTHDPAVKKHLQTRLKAIVELDKLEKKVAEYKKAYNRLPEKITDLLSAGLIESLPEDPYGGQFYLLPNGRVFTTSKLRFNQKIIDPSP